MGEVDYKELFTKRNRIKKQWLSLNPKLNNESGIYVLLREENGYKYGYIGQAKHILDRLISHSEGFEQHIDRSIKSHKFYSADNPTGYKVLFKNYPIEQLDEMEQKYTKYYANAGYQLRNKTSGSQGEGKAGISENRNNRGFYEGVAYGYEKAMKEVRVYFDKYLDFSIKDKPNKIKERKLEEFKQFLQGKQDSGN